MCFFTTFYKNESTHMLALEYTGNFRYNSRCYVNKEPL